MSRRHLLALLGAALVAACGRKGEPRWSKDSGGRKKTDAKKKGN